MWKSTSIKRGSFWLSVIFSTRFLPLILFQMAKVKKRHCEPADWWIAVSQYAKNTTTVLNIRVSVFILSFQYPFQLRYPLRESKAVTLMKGIGVDLLHGEATFHASHGLQQQQEPTVSLGVFRRKQPFPTAQPCQQQYLAKVGSGIVFRWRSPPLNDVFYTERFVLRTKMAVVGLQHFPSGPIAVGHAFKLHKALVVLYFRSSLPAVGGMTDIKRIVVTDSSWCIHGSSVVRHRLALQRR